MRVLVTGNRGMIGSVVEKELIAAGHQVTGFDIADGHDIRDAESVARAAAGCDAISHLAAVVADSGGPPEKTMSVNVLGTWNVLCAAEQAGASRVISFSSVNAMGIFRGERAPDYFPIDEDHPCCPWTPYGISKRLGEEMCRCFTARTGIATICLRPPGVFDEGRLEHIRSKMTSDPGPEAKRHWEYGAFLDVRDAAGAVACALECDDPGHVTLLLCADDVLSVSATSRELASLIHPDVPWRGGPEYDEDPYRSLVDTRRARKVLGWRPRHAWRT